MKPIRFKDQSHTLQKPAGMTDQRVLPASCLYGWQGVYLVLEAVFLGATPASLRGKIVGRNFEWRHATADMDRH